MAKKTKREYLQSIVHEYMIEFGVETVNLDKVADWAVATKKYQRNPRSMQKQAKDEIARALRGERHIDPQGRVVRTMHPIKVVGEQGTFSWEWDDIRSAKPERMRIAFSYRRQAILADVHRHKNDVDSYNDNNNYNELIPLFDYDFNKDVAEGEMPTEYNEDELDFDLDGEEETEDTKR
ncbi:MAG: hypothetical protein ACRCYY_11805 [Trueperaceae bacterium]